MLELNDYRQLAQGLTESEPLVNYLKNNNIPHFENSKFKAKRYLNSAYAGVNESKNDGKFKIEALVDNDAKQMQVVNGLNVSKYDFDELDDSYVKDLPKGKGQKPMTKLAVSILDKIHSDTPDRPILNQDMQLSGSKNVLRQAFANEMVFSSAMSKYMKKTGLGHDYEAHKDKYTKLIDTKGTELSFNDGMKDLEHKITPKKQKGLRR